jgi:hypothetical protein
MSPYTHCMQVTAYIPSKNLAALDRLSSAGSETDAHLLVVMTAGSQQTLAHS